MEISLDDVRHALVELGRLRFGEMSVEEAMREIVDTTHSMFAVDGGGLMLADRAHHLRAAYEQLPSPVVRRVLQVSGIGARCELEP